MGKRKPDGPKRPTPSRDAIGQGVYAINGSGYLKRLEIRDMKSFQKKVGEHLLNAIVRAFNASERLDSLVFLGHLAATSDESGSARAGRLMRTVAFYEYGTLYEAKGALHAMHTAGIARLVGKENAQSLKLDDLRRRLEKDELLKKLRHHMAHHLGDPLDIARGLEPYVKDGRTLVFVSNERLKSGVMHVSHPFVFEVLMGAVDCTEAEFFEFIHRAAADARTFVEALGELFRDVLRKIGVRLPR